MFVLKILQDRIPLKQNIYSRGLLEGDDVMCWVGYQKV